MKLLEMRDIVFRAGNKTILDRLSLSIEAVEVHALIGTNGTGKSTLAAVLMGCEGYRPDAGEIIFDGRVINGLRIDERARIGITMAWQEPARFEGLGVSDYLTLGGGDIDAAHLLAMVGLEPSLYLQRQVDRSLSGGERKRVELASVLGLRPRLTILDEPDSGIDMLSTGDIMGVIATFKKIGSAVLLITHREEIALMADRASLICRGRIVCSGEPARVATWYKERKCLLCDGKACDNV